MVARVRYRRWFMTKTLPLDPLSSSLLMEPELLLPLNGCLDISKGKRAAPPKAEKLVDHHLDVAMKAVAKFSGHPLILVGKSMGSRVSMVACTGKVQVSAVLCLGYPLKAHSAAEVASSPW